jgi:hypothetical protein
MKFILPESVSSPQDVMALIDELTGLARAAAHNSMKRGGNTAAALSPQAAQLLAGAKKELTDTAFLREAAAGLEEIYKTAPRVFVTLAAPATPDVRNIVTEWFRKNISPRVLVQLQFNHALLGGIVVRSGSHIHDWSFRDKLLKNASAFTETLTHV